MMTQMVRDSLLGPPASLVFDGRYQSKEEARKYCM